MSNFKNMEELLGHLVSGGAITNLDDSCKDCWLSLHDGELRFPNHTKNITDLGDPTQYRPVPVKWLTENIHRNTKKTPFQD